MTGQTVTGQVVRLWARLTAAVIQHWLTVGTIGGDATRSLDKVYKAVRAFVGRLAKALDNALELDLVLDDLRKTFRKTCRRDTRSKTGPFEMLSNIDLLDYGLNGLT